MRILLVGAAGYGETYLGLLDGMITRWSELSAVVDPCAAASSYFPRLIAERIPVYSALEDCLQAQDADLVIISSPIQLHEEQVLMALKHGAHVLCEKPLTATLEQAARIEQARLASGRQCGVGFQWSFSPTMRQLKRNIRAGLYGKPLCLKAHIAWPRGVSYYASSPWKGRLRDDQGRWVLDSIASNAGAHYLHNLFYVLGDEEDAARMPESLEGSLYRAHDTESFDTCFLRGTFPGGCRFYFCATHVSDSTALPSLRYEFEHATVEMDASDQPLFVHWRDGRRECLGIPSQEVGEKLTQMQQSARDNTPPVCGIRTTLPHLTVCNALFRSIPIHTFPASLLRRGPDPDALAVEGLFDAMRTCYNQEKMPAELGHTWAAPTTGARLSPL